MVRFGALGDVIQLTALVSGLAARWGAACDLVAAAGGAPRKVLAHLPSVGEIFTLESRRTPYLVSGEQRRLVRWLRRRAGGGPVYVIEELPKVFRLLERGGVAADRVLSVRDLPRGDLEHAVAYHHRLLAAEPPAFRAAPPAPPADPAPEPRLAVSAEELADCRRWLAGRAWEGLPLVLFQTLSRRANRGRWPEERWRAVAAGVLARLPAARVVLVGAPAEEAELGLLARALGGGRVEVAAADLPLRRLFALLTLAHSCVSLDTGPAHAAAVLGCPVVVLVGRADPRRNRPLAPPGRAPIVTAWPEGEWPASRAEWEATHRLDGIAAEAVLATWRALPPRAP